LTRFSSVLMAFSACTRNVHYEQCGNPTAPYWL
jgi:hypothetical protein